MHDALRRDVAKQVQPFRTQHRGQLEVSTGVEILGERSIDRTGHMAGDWIERLDFTAKTRCMNGMLYQVDSVAGMITISAAAALLTKLQTSPSQCAPHQPPGTPGKNQLKIRHVLRQRDEIFQVKQPPRHHLQRQQHHHQ